ncbi:MAG: ydfH 6 [Solirubrobacterales bacterium]|jgi:DNA-binding GntR family transcriptional regulator|nr:ydfH 6 [Solirubrobacterales bacterium]
MSAPGHRLSSSARPGGGALVDQLAQDIQARIARGELRIGSRLRQESLAHDYGVSRTPIREALRKLQAGGVVVLVRHRGAIVQGQTPRQIREAYVVRAEVEGLAARLAADRAGAEDVSRLIDAEKLFRAAAEEFVAMAKSAGRDGLMRGGAWDEANNRFHDTLIDAAGNDRLSRTIRAFHRTLPRNLTWTALSDEPRLIEENVRQHEGIREAIERHDAAAARRRMIDHVGRAGELVAEWFERHDLGETPI